MDKIRHLKRAEEILKSHRPSRDTLQLTKPDLAKELLKDAIFLFFNGKFTGAHNLAADALWIVHDLMKKKNIVPVQDRFLFKKLLNELDPTSKDWKILNDISNIYCLIKQNTRSTRNAYKHANQEQSPVSPISPGHAEMIIYQAIREWNKLDGGLPLEFKIFLAWGYHYMPVWKDRRDRLWMGSLDYPELPVDCSFAEQLEYGRRMLINLVEPVTISVAPEKTASGS